MLNVNLSKARVWKYNKLPKWRKSTVDHETKLFMQQCGTKKTYVRCWLWSLSIVRMSQVLSPTFFRSPTDSIAMVYLNSKLYPTIYNLLAPN